MTWRTDKAGRAAAPSKDQRWAHLVNAASNLDDRRTTVPELLDGALEVFSRQLEPHEDFMPTQSANCCWRCDARLLDASAAQRDQAPAVAADDAAQKKDAMSNAPNRK